MSEQQIWAVALASAIAARNNAFTRAIEAAAQQHLDAAHLQAARAAAAIMGMNNIYYRFLHLVEDAEYQSMPARLRVKTPGACPKVWLNNSLRISPVTTTKVRAAIQPP